MTANIESEISKLQLLEQNLKGIEMQKQNVQLQLFESENSLKELPEIRFFVNGVVKMTE